MILIAIPNRDFDPTEVAVPWRVLSDAGYDVRFATPDGEPGSADPRVLHGRGFGPWRFLLAATRDAVRTYSELEAEPAFRRPLRYDAVRLEELQGLLLPGGHAPGMRPYLESTVLMELVAAAFAAHLPVAAICHGVLLAARARDPASARSPLFGRRTTALPSRMELPAWLLTAAWLGRYLRTYDESVESEVKRNLADARHFDAGPLLPNRGRGFAVVDRNYVSARWPGDAQQLAQAFVGVLRSGASPVSGSCD